MRKQRGFWGHNEKGVYFCKRWAYNLAITEFERAVSASAIPPAALDINLGAVIQARALGTFSGSRTEPVTRG